MALERYALLADESGNADEPLRVLAGLSGPLKGLLALERELRGVLWRHGLAELKWAALRTRPRRLGAAAEFLDLAESYLKQRCLALDLLVWEQSEASLAWEGLSKEERWLQLYLALVKRVRSRWKGATLKQLALYPDQRTGMRWSRLKRQSGLKAVRESSSKKLALIQLADLLAGMGRFLRQEDGHGPKHAGLRALKNRWLLAEAFEAICRKQRRQVGLWKVTKIEGGLK
jgi:hypothetical protein